MLLNLLPGLRELRAPLAAGYLWILAAWLILKGDLPNPAGAASFLDQFSGLGSAAALSFAAYLIGSLLTDLFAAVLSPVRLVRTGPIRGQPHAYPQGLRAKNRLRERLIRMQSVEALSREGAAALDGVSRRAVARIPTGERQHFDATVFTDDYTVRGLGGWLWFLGRRVRYRPNVLRVEGNDQTEDLALRVAVALGDELDIARFRLLSEQRDLFHEVDRLSAEGDFRVAVATPLVVLSLYLGLGDHPLWLLGIPASLLIAWLGMNRQEQAGDRIVYAIRAGKVSTPILERIELSARETPTGQEADGEALIGDGLARRVRQWIDARRGAGAAVDGVGAAPASQQQTTK